MSAQQHPYPEEQETEFEEILEEDPIEIEIDAGSSGGSPLNGGTPATTRFKRKVVIATTIIGLSTFGAAAVWGIWGSNAFQPKAKEGKFQAVTVAPLPDSIQNVPATYGAAQTPPKLGQPTNPVANPPASATGAIAAQRPMTPPIVPYPQIPGYPPYPSAQIPQVSPAEKELLEARKSAIAFSGTNSQTPSQAQTTILPMTRTATAQTAPPQPTAQSTQGKSFFSSSQPIAPMASTVLQAGTVIPASLLSGINSDLPGQVVAQVREDVYDSVTGQNVLVPLGSRIIGFYDNKITYGQERVGITWNRLIFPNGYSLDLEGLQGSDNAGYSGLKDRVNNHTGRLLRGVLISSILAAGASIATGGSPTYYDQQSFGQLAGRGAAENIAGVGQKLAEKDLSIPPTVTIRPGTRFTVIVDKDFALSPYQ